MKKIILAFALLPQLLIADDFLNLVKKTSSVYSHVADIDANNPSFMNFETLLNNQKIFLVMSAAKLNSSFLTILNTDLANKAKKYTSIPDIHIHNLQIGMNNDTTPTLSCNGDGIGVDDTSCFGHACTIVQRVISKCNEEDCWVNNPAVDRKLSEELSEDFSLRGKIEITDCVSDNFAGMKHILNISVTNESVNLLRGGTIQYSLVLQNDVAPVAKKDWSKR